MASYRPFPPPPPHQPPYLPPAPPNQAAPLPPPPLPSGSNYQTHQSYQHQQQIPSSSSAYSSIYGNLPPNPGFASLPRPRPYHQQQPQQHYQLQPPMAPPPPSTSGNLPPPPPRPASSSTAPVYYPSSTSSTHYPAEFNSAAAPPLAPLPPPPPPLPSSPPPLPPPQPKERGPSVQTIPHRRSETEEERTSRKKREYEKQRLEEKKRQMLKQSHSLASGMKVHGSMPGSRNTERKAAPLLGDRTENRLKKPTTFLCKLRFRNELPDPSAQPKLLPLNTDKDRYSRYNITSLEKMHKPKLYLEPDLGIPLDLLDMSIYNRPRGFVPLDPEDEELLRDTEMITPIKQDGIKRKERPTDKGVSWLVKTQYISPLSMDAAKLSINEKQAKEMKQTREGRSMLEDLNNREKQIEAIEESFRAAKLRPVHQSKPGLEPVEIFPLIPDFDRYEDKFVMVSFDGDPTADDELFRKLDKATRDEHESKAIMKSCLASGTDPGKPEKFLAYMVPVPDEISNDIYHGDEDTSYAWVREYHWDVKGDDAEDPTTYLVHFDENTARYLPLPTKLALQKKRAKEGRSTDELEHYAVPSRITVRSGSTVVVRERGNNDAESSRDGKRAKSAMGQKAAVEEYSGEEEESD